MNINKFDVNKGKAIVTIVVVVAIVVVIFVFGKNIVQFINGLFGKDDPQQSAARDQLLQFNYQSSNPNSPFSPKVYQNRPSGTTVISEDLAGSIISDIASSAGYLFGIGKDSSQAYAAIQQCNSQCDVSYCTYLFQQRFSKDMYDYMSSNFGSGNDIVVMNQILSFVKSLPVYN